MVEKKSKEERTRNWTFIIYPESAPEEWRNILDGEHIQWVESPLHDKDMNADGEAEKKAHWHILLMFEGHKSFEQISEITCRLNGTIPQKVASARGLVRYMAHLDNPEKYQYSRSEVIGHGGVDVTEYLKPTSLLRYELIDEMIVFVEDNDIREFKDLIYYARANRRDDWFPLLCDSSYLLGSLIKSQRHAHEREQ